MLSEKFLAEQIFCRIIGFIEIFEGFGRLLLGVKQPSWSMKFIIWQTRWERKRRNKNNGN